MNLHNIPAVYPEGAAAQQQAAQMQQAAAISQAAQARQIAGMTQAGAAAQAAMPVSHRPMRQAGRQHRAWRCGSIRPASAAKWTRSTGSRAWQSRWTCRKA